MASNPTQSHTIGGGALAQEDRASIKQSGESIYHGGSPICPTRAKNVFKQHKATVADIMSDIGQLQIFRSGDMPLEDLLARDDIPENATVLQDFRRGVKSGDIRSMVSSPCRSPFTLAIFLWL